MKKIALILALTAMPCAANAKDKPMPPEQEAYATCIGAKTADYAAMDIPAETASKGVIGACKDEEDALTDALSKPGMKDILTYGKWRATSVVRERVEAERDAALPSLEARILSEILEIRRAKP